jgi:probable rRNA maturation factor
MIEVEVFGASLAPEAPSAREIELLCARAAASRGIRAAHVAIQFVDAARIARLNAEHRGTPDATDVLSFPIDGAGALGGQAPSVEALGRTRAGARAGRAPSAARPPSQPRELGDVVICPERTVDVREAIVHGMLHLLGMDHERDDGEMLALQRELLEEAGR